MQCNKIIFIVPSAPPHSVTASVINTTSAWIRWDPPPVHSWNGELSGYLVINIPFPVIAN